jgi:hypothetical protein
LQPIINLKIGPFPYLGLELTIHLIKSQIHFVRQFLKAFDGPVKIISTKRYLVKLNPLKKVKPDPEHCLTGGNAYWGM